MSVALVVPTNRPESLAVFRRAWEGAAWDDVIVVYDGTRRDCAIEWPSATVYCWEDYERVCGADAWIISRCDSACRCLGFLEAIRRGARYVVSLDDDCLPVDGDVAAFPSEHVRQLERPPRWVSSVPGLRVRGMPEGGDGTIERSDPVLVNMGLWRGVPDLSAAETLALRSRLGAGSAVLNDFEPPPGNRVASPHQLFPFSGMNIAFRSSALPALYFPKMGAGSPYARFDDIWCGVLLQRICAQTGDLLTIGEPWVHHKRASDVFVNLRKEAPGVSAHERYWRIISELSVTGSSLVDCVGSAADGLVAQDDPYLVEWGRALRRWLLLSAAALAGREG